MKNVGHIFIVSIFITLVVFFTVSSRPGLSAHAREYVSSESTGDEFEDLLKGAVELYKQKKYDDALINCTKAAELNPKSFRPYYMAGFIFLAQLKLKSASESFAKAILLNPGEKRIYIMKARADSMRGEKEEAIAACRKALELDPDFAEAYWAIGNTLRFDEKRTEEAIAAYKSALKLNPGVLEAYEDLAQLLERTKDEKGAEEILRKGMEVDPKHMTGRFELGRMLVKQGRLKEARILWEGKTSDEDRTFPNFITLLVRAEKLKLAIDALAVKPDDPETLLQMGNAVMDGDSWVVDGRQERAIIHFRNALKIRPDFAPVQYAICKAYVQIADTFKDKNKNLDEELIKLRKLDSKLAAEIDEYRKTYSGGLRGVPANLNQ